MDEPKSVDEQHYKVLIEYLRVKVEQKDWHAVADVANDLREMEAKHPWLK